MKKDRFAERQKTASLKDKRRLTLRQIIFVLFPLSIVLFLSGCREYQVSHDPSLRLAFSEDTVCFDTVFTEQGSATMQLMVYNPNANALVIDRVWVDDGRLFKVNVDGEADLTRLKNLTIYGGDSMLVFVRICPEALNSNSPILVSDKIHFHLASDHSQTVVLEAYGQDATRIGRRGCQRTEIAGDYTFTAEKPYIVFDTLHVGGNLTIDAGARIYMHQGANIYVQGDFHAQGTREAPILIRGDRLDYLFDSVPYLYAGGSWGGIYLQSESPRSYRLSYTDILSGTVGLACTSTCTAPLPTLRLDGCRIHNHNLYGLVLSHVDALVTNTEISNCASYCVYCEGGEHKFIHSTVASYFGYTNIRIQSATKENAAAVYINNLSKTVPQTVTSFYNSVVTGYTSNQVVVATPFDQYYPGVFIGNYLKTDTLRMPHAGKNVYYEKTADTTAVFVKDFYKYKEYVYYDFRPDSLSPLRGIGDSIAALPYPLDRNGVSRAGTKPDAGCYQYLP